MTTQHTPGPWSATAEGMYPVVRNDGSMFVNAEHSVKAGDVNIATVHCWTATGCCPRVSNTFEASANARLIAAAPKLLAELEALVARCDGREGTQPDDSNMDTRGAHAAIEQARGES